jgi:hypothetical protein
MKPQLKNDAMSFEAVQADRPEARGDRHNARSSALRQSGLAAGRVYLDRGRPGLAPYRTEHRDDRAWPFSGFHGSPQPA